MFGWLKEFSDNLTCEFCDKEVFDGEYICEECRKKLPYHGEFICPTCGKKTFPGSGICNECKETYPLYRFARAPFQYDGELIPKIHAFKDGDKYLAKPFSLEMFPYLRLFQKAELIVSVPLSEESLWERGYNQAELLARELSVLGEIPYGEGLLERIKDEDEQKNLSRRERMKNIKRSFRVKDKAQVIGKGVVIVDDVMTTGATANEITRVLLDAGASHTYVLTIASTPLKDYGV